MESKNSNKKFRILIPMLSYYPDYPNGASRLAFDEAVYLSKIGHEIWIITQDLEKSKMPYSFENNLHVIRYPSPTRLSFDPRRINIHQNLTKIFLKKYLTEPVDIIHGHSLLQYKGAVDLYQASARAIYSVHSPVRLELLTEKKGKRVDKQLKLFIAAHLNHEIEKQCLVQSDLIMVYSNYTAALLHELYGSAISQRVKILPGWVDLDRYKVQIDRQPLKIKLGWPVDQPVLFTLRRLVPRMGIDRLIMAVQKVKSFGLNLHLYIGGSGDLRSSLENLVNKMNLAQSVHFMGRVPDDILPTMYSAADAFILPTKELECFGLIAIESLASGRPVLATPVGAIPEIMNKVESAWLSQDSSVESIANLLVNYLTNNLPKHEPESLREQMKKHYSQDLVLDRWAKALCD